MRWSLILLLFKTALTLHFEVLETKMFDVKTEIRLDRLNMTLAVLLDSLRNSVIV